MRHGNRKCFRLWLTILLLPAIAGRAVEATRAAELVLKDGRILRGKLGKVAKLGEAPKPDQADGEGPIQNIILLDDDLRRTFFSDRQVREVLQEENRQVDEKFTIRQRVMRAGNAIKSVGQPLRVQPFDEYGRRIFTMATSKGPTDIIQGITEMTPQYAKVEGISHIWDMRIATSNIPRDSLEKILLKQIDLKNPEHYKKVARFYLQSERYEDARRVLESLLTNFPKQTDLKEQIAPSLRSIVQLSAQQRLQELRLRREAGQFNLVYAYLRQFPTEGVGGEILQGVREMIQDHETREARRAEIVKQLRALAERLKDTIAKENLKPILDEIEAEINQNTIDRMAAFMQCAADEKTPDRDKLALAVSGWLLGADSATEKLPVAISAYKVRGLLRKYLNGTNAPEREGFYSYIKQESGGELSVVAALIAHMKPPIAAPEPLAADKPGNFEIEAPGLSKEEPATYRVQLPPEYDPYRLYPAIVTLHGAGDSPERQIDWWAGNWGKAGLRTGQAARRGYIVIAPAWTEPHQKQYGYSAREHAIVLNSLRDACRRFSIDTDRVYLSGQSIGGDAAWDIGLAHPDLWAGVVPIVALADRYCTMYWENGRYVPFYVVAGELDGGRLVKNAKSILDRWLRYGFNATVVEYQGRGHEDFYDEILRIFDWMGRYRRNFFPREFLCETMRTWDNYFWWVEIQGLPPRSMVQPIDWPPPNGAQPVQVKARMTDNNGLTIRTGANQVTVWISPRMLDFKKRATITVNGRRINAADQIIRPELRVLLEDVRTRGDRQHPFWAKVDNASGRVRGE